MARICRSCLMVSGRVTRRTITVKTMIAMPMLLKQMVYSTTSRFNMGLIMISRQRSSIPKKGPAFFPGSDRKRGRRELVAHKLADVA